jgi:ubiquinone/menaquinone biosynthesis C-methylase UbiE
MTIWTDFDLSAIRQQYDRIAPYYEILERLLFLPPRIRIRGVAHLAIGAGNHVLEVGCGTGLNLALLSRAVGPKGCVYGVDLSEGMLSRARKRCQSLANVTLTHSDALNFTAPVPLDAVLFSLSYNTLPHHTAVLGHSWSQLKGGGRLVIMDAKLPSGRFGELILPLIIPLMRHTVVANPLIQPWEELRCLADQIEMEQLLFSYYVCSAKKNIEKRRERAFQLKLAETADISAYV